MTYYQSAPEGKDPQLWRLAGARASFRTHLSTYLVLSLFFWVLWSLTGGHNYNGGVPWPVYPMLGWGIGLFFHYTAAYVRPQSNRTEQEYEKLVQQQQTSKQDI
jgi:hypothetical protein